MDDEILGLLFDLEALLWGGRSSAECDFSTTFIPVDGDHVHTGVPRELVGRTITVWPIIEHADLTNPVDGVVVVILMLFAGHSLGK